jgi:hypothetical protein
VDEETRSRIATLTGRRVMGARRAAGGYTRAERWVVALADGDSCFAKIGTDDHTRRTVADEARFYAECQLDFTPSLLGFDHHPDRPMLLLEDLSRAYWPPPWDRKLIERVRHTLDRVAATDPPAHLPDLERQRQFLSGWRGVEADPIPFLGLELASPGWLEGALPELANASDRAVLSGSSLVHFDVRSDNLALLSDRTVLVDWASPAVGNPLLDIVGWLPSLHFEGGPRPDQVLGAEATELAALVAGYFALHAGLPPPPTAPTVRAIQLASLRVALPWACRLLGLPPPDGPPP